MRPAQWKRAGISALIFAAAATAGFVSQPSGAVKAEIKAGASEDALQGAAQSETFAETGGALRIDALGSGSGGALQENVSDGAAEGSVSGGALDSAAQDGSGDTAPQGDLPESEPQSGDFSDETEYNSEPQTQPQTQSQAQPQTEGPFEAESESDWGVWEGETQWETLSEEEWTEEEPWTELPDEPDFWADDGDAPVGATEAEIATEVETEEGVPLLADTNGDVEVILYAPDGDMFPVGIMLRLLSISDVIGETEEKEERCAELEKQLLDAWELEDPDALRAFFPYYIMLMDGQGNEIGLQGEAEVRIVVSEETFYQDALTRNDAYRIAYQEKGNEFEEITEKEVLRDDEKHSVTVCFQADRLEWLSLLQMEGEALDTPALEEEAPEDEEFDYSIAPTALAPSGSKVTSPGSGFVKMSPSNLDGSYRPVRWYSGLTSFAPFNNAGSAVKCIPLTSDNTYVFYPVNNSAKGKFGGIYRNILYQAGQWYDLKMTVTDYSDQTYAGTKGEWVDSYPPIGFGTQSIRWRFTPPLGEYIMKLEFYRAGDPAQTPVALNVRFQWWEVDNAQRFGIRTGDGSIAAKYYQVDDSLVYYKNQKAVDGNTYLFVTASGNMDWTNKQGNVGIALSGCSTYYMAIGYRDHMEDDADYRGSKNSIEERNKALRSDSVEGVSLGTLKQTDVDVPIPPDTAYPQKFTSNDAASWSASNSLPSPGSEYYYRISQYVPWQTENNYYSAFAITDTLPAGVDYVGSIGVTRAEDHADVTGQFTCSAANDTVTVTPAASFLQNSGFYGYTFDIVFKVRMDPGEMNASYSGNTATYQVTNTASVSMTFSNGGGTFQNRSNAVTTQASVARNLPGTPKKGLDGNENLTRKQLGTREETITFSVYQSVPANEPAWRPVRMTLTDTLADCLEYRSAKMYEKGQNGYVQSDGWAASASGQTVSITRDFRPNNVTVRFDITCGIRAGYDLSRYVQTEGNKLWYVIPNTAQVELVWAGGSPASVKNTTNQAEVRLYAGLVKVHLMLTKEIDAADIVWAHGNPTFTFRVDGEDADGGKHTYYETVEFTSSQTPESGRASLTADIEVPAGWYTATEEKTMRYLLDSISGVTCGNVTGSTVAFDVSRADSNAKAVFYNRKTTDAEETHSAFARNVLGEHAN